MIVPREDAPAAETNYYMHDDVDENIVLFARAPAAYCKTRRYVRVRRIIGESARAAAHCTRTWSAFTRTVVSSGLLGKFSWFSSLYEVRLGQILIARRFLILPFRFVATRRI